MIEYKDFQEMIKRNYTTMPFVQLLYLQGSQFLKDDVQKAPVKTGMK